MPSCRSATVQFNHGIGHRRPHDHALGRVLRSGMAVWPVGGIDMYWVAGILTLLLLGYLIEAMLEPERF